jgi:hypothetical protein
MQLKFDQLPSFSMNVPKLRMNVSSDRNFMKKLAILFLLLMGALTNVWGQSDYFQQEVAYEIHVRLDDVLHEIRGYETIHYTNHSTQALDTLFIHLWPNAFKDQRSAFAKQQLENGSVKYRDSKPESRGFIDSLDFQMDGQHVEWKEWKGNPDIACLALPKPIPAGATVKLATPFRVKVPDSFSRLGHIEQQYQFCQWYPKPAVFDRLGWHPMPYLDQGEFFSEYGTFDVFLEVPKNYVVGATGDLPKGDPEVVWLNRREATSRVLLDQKPTEAKFVQEFAPDVYKTLHFHQENVHDFAWFCDKEYYVLADTVKLAGSGKEVRCVAMFGPKDRDLWRRDPEYVAKAVYYYSLWNGDYPYNHATAVDGALSAGAGMEYPNITVLGAGGSAENLEMVTMHEVGHNWYYGILGSNERAHPWMDEGLNTYFEGRYWRELHKDELNMIPKVLQEKLGIHFTHSFMAREGYRLSAGSNQDQPLEGEAAEFTNMNYGVIVYMKTGLVFDYLEKYLGRDLIDKCFHAYFDQWKFKHPYPQDVQAVFERVSGQDLDWFFKDFVNGTHKLDFRIQKREGNVFTIKNNSGTTLPASLSLLDKEGNVLKTYWTKPFDKETTLEVESEDFVKAQLNVDGAIPEIREDNNSLRKQGLFKRARPFALDFLYKYPTPDKFHLGLSPAIGYNTTDGFMGGILLYHNVFPEKPFSFHLLPMFGFKSSHVVGSTGFTYRWYPHSIFRKIELKAIASSYSSYLRIRPTLTFHLQKGKERSPFEHNLSLGFQLLAVRNAEKPYLAPNDWYLPVYGSAKWMTHAHTVLSDFNLNAEVGANLAEPLVRGSLEASYSHRILKKMRGNIRGFAGMGTSPGGLPYLLQYRVAGSNDPFGENVLLDRAGNTSWLSHQILRDHGGFNSLVANGSFNQALFSLNGNLRLPLKFLSVFGDFAQGMSTTGNKAFYDAGFRVSVLKDVLQVNFPIVGTTFGGLPSSGKTFWQGVNFSFDPMKATQNLLPSILGN